jgi:glycosyltransferase involved in cell wall biosynthesis
VTEGDRRRATGGNIYAQHMVDALARAGLSVRTLRLGDRGAKARLRDTRARLVLVDTIAAAAAPQLSRLRASGTRVATVALMERGAATLARRSDRVIACSHALAREIRARGIPRSRIVVVPPGVTRPPARRVARPDRSRRVRALCVANWTKAKGIRTLLAAIEWLPDVSLDLVGDTPDPAYARLIRADLRRAPLRGRVRVHGVKRDAALARLYARADVFALPSITESYGIAVADALAAGLPVIACDIPATREVAGGAAILVPRGRVDPLADAIARVAGDADLRRRMSRRSRERAAKLPTWERSERDFVRAVKAASGATASRTSSGGPRGPRRGTAAGTRSSRAR